jgi:hypothetical protein
MTTVFSYCLAKKETDNAVLVYVPGLKAELWIPKTAIHESSFIKHVSDEGELHLDNDWANENIPKED